MISPVQCADTKEAPTLTSHTPANPGGMRELMLRGLRSAPLFLLLPLPGNYSPGCAFGCYRDPSSASPSSSWRIRQLLLLPRLLLMLLRQEAAGSCYPGTFRSLHFCSCSAASLPLGTPLLSFGGLTPGDASRSAPAPLREVQAQPIPPRLAGLVAGCAWGSATFGEAAPPTRVHPHTAPSLFPSDCPDAPVPPRSVHSSATPQTLLRTLPSHPHAPLYSPSFLRLDRPHKG